MEFEDIHKNLKQIQRQIERAAKLSGRMSQDVTIVAATKLQPLNKLRALSQMGINQFGENYLQEAVDKQSVFLDLKIDWHYIGRIQSKKWRKILELFDTIHSFDRFDLLQPEILNQLVSRKQVYIELNLANESSKGGIDPVELERRMPQILECKNFFWKGLMVMPPLLQNAEETRPYFRHAKDLLNVLWSKYFKDTLRSDEFRGLSMGTSHDFEVAIEEGATVVRLGSCLLGERKRGES